MRKMELKISHSVIDIFLITPYKTKVNIENRIGHRNLQLILNKINNDFNILF